LHSFVLLFYYAQYDKLLADRTYNLLRINFVSIAYTYNLLYCLWISVKRYWHI